MDSIDFERERRKQRRLDKLGSSNPLCGMCGESDDRTLELHHVAGRKHDELVAILCRNCHRKPFGFLLAMSEVWDLRGEEFIATSPKGRRKTASKIKPVAPFETDPEKAVELAFDRETGEPVPASALRSYAEALEQYHLSPESKFLNGDFVDCGITQRRHIQMGSVLHIGKEAHDWERQAAVGRIEGSEIAYGVDQEDFASRLEELIAKSGDRMAAVALRVSKSQLRALLSGAKSSRIERLVNDVAMRLPTVFELCADQLQKKAVELAVLTTAVKRDGLRPTAKHLGVDPSNLRRRLNAHN